MSPEPRGYNTCDTCGSLLEGDEFYDHDHRNDYDVAVANTFEATCVADAVRQMVEWLQLSAGLAGYRVIMPNGTDMFVDAEDV